MIQVQVLYNFINDVLDETSEKYELILGKTKQDVDNIKESYKYLFTGISFFAGTIITMISALIIEFSIGVGIIFLTFVIALVVLLKRQRKIRKMNDAYGEYIAILGQKKDAFIKIRKQINYWENIRADLVVKQDDRLSPKNIRNVLNALDVIDNAYHLYHIHVYEKLFSLLEIETKSTIFRTLMYHIKNSIQTARELTNVISKSQPFYVRNEVYRILNDIQKYIPKNFKEPLASPNYEIFINSKDFIDIKFGGTWNLIKILGFKKYSEQIQKIRNYEFSLDEKLNVIKKHKKSRMKIESKKIRTSWDVIGVLFFVIGVAIIAMGWFVFNVADIKQADIDERDYSVPKETKIDFEDVEPMRSWNTEAEIFSDDEKTLEVGNQKLLNVIVTSPNPPIDLVVHIYHEDMDVYFTDEEDPSAFHQVTEQLNRVPTLEYGSIFHIELDTKEYWNCVQEEKENCNHLLQNRKLVSFPRSGTYFVLFSAKLDENKFDHRRSPDSLTKIYDPREIKLEEQLSKLQRSADLLHPISDRSFGVAVMGIGVAFMVAGMTYVRKN